MNLTGRNAIVTAAGRGLGRAIAESLAGATMPPRQPRRPLRVSSVRRGVKQGWMTIMPSVMKRTAGGEVRSAMSSSTATRAAA